MQTIYDFDLKETGRGSWLILGQKPYRAKQIYMLAVPEKSKTFDEMTDLPASSD